MFFLRDLSGSFQSFYSSKVSRKIRGRRNPKVSFSTITTTDTRTIVIVTYPKCKSFDEIERLERCRGSDLALDSDSSNGSNGREVQYNRTERIQNELRRRHVAILNRIVRGEPSRFGEAIYRNTLGGLSNRKPRAGV